MVLSGGCAYATTGIIAMKITSLSMGPCRLSHIDYAPDVCLKREASAILEHNQKR